MRNRKTCLPEKKIVKKTSKLCDNKNNQIQNTKSAPRTCLLENPHKKEGEFQI
jgi:hypothetical protein